MIETNAEWDQEGSIGIIRDGNTIVASLVAPSLVVVQLKALFEVKVAIPRPPFTMKVALSLAYHPKVVPYDYVVLVRRKGKYKQE